MGVAETASERATSPFVWGGYGSTGHVVKDSVASGTKHSGHFAVSKTGQEQWHQIRWRPVREGPSHYNASSSANILC